MVIQDETKTRVISDNQLPLKLGSQGAERERERRLVQLRFRLR